MPTRDPTPGLRCYDNVMIRCSVMVYEDLMIVMMILNLEKSLGNRPLESSRTRWKGDLKNKYQIVRL
jgi:hypothetical protein